jgi:hypothetical protein
MTTPWWRSFASRLRVPKITVKTASPTATQVAVTEGAAGAGAAGSVCAKAATESVTDCSCSAM